MKISKKFFLNCIGILCLIIIIYNVTSTIISQKEKYSPNYWSRFADLKKMYYDSQYATKHPKGWLPDEAVFSYAGGAYVNGANPILIVPDAPTLGKYLIGFSALIFNNENVIVAMFGVFSLVLLYALSYQVLGNKILSFIPVALFSSESLFKNQFVFMPLMDLFQLVFILSYFLLINKGFVSQKWTILFFVLANIFLGFFISTKFFASGITIMVASLLWTVIHFHVRKFVYLLITFPIASMILLASYIRVFAFGYNFHQFLGIQKWIFLYHKGQLILPFSVWMLLLFNQWYVWFGNKAVISDSQWTALWPFITVFSFITMILYLVKKIERKTEIEILMLWSVCYLLFLSFGDIFSRYFLILLPVFYIISLYGIVQVAKKFEKPVLIIQMNKS